eukprot:6160036-Amphidinium_carterae.1
MAGTTTNGSSQRHSPTMWRTWLKTLPMAVRMCHYQNVLEISAAGAAFQGSQCNYSSCIWKFDALFAENDRVTPMHWSLRDSGRMLWAKDGEAWGFTQASGILCPAGDDHKHVVRAGCNVEQGGVSDSLSWVPLHMLDASEFIQPSELV